MPEARGFGGKTVLAVFHKRAEWLPHADGSRDVSRPLVILFIEEHVVPVKLPHDSKPCADDYMVKWTPTLITANGGGKEHHRTVGFLPPEEMIPSVLLGVGKVHFDADRIDKALGFFDQIVEKYPKSDSTAEAIPEGGLQSQGARTSEAAQKGLPRGSSGLPDERMTNALILTGCCEEYLYRIPSFLLAQPVQVPRHDRLTPVRTFYPPQKSRKSGRAEVKKLGSLAGLRTAAGS